MAEIFNENASAILGGTGDQGLGLALRFAKARQSVVIGSRKLDRALTAADEVRSKVPGAQVEGFENSDATARAGVVILSVPFEHTAGTVKAIRDVMRPGQILVSMAVPLATAVGGAAAHMLGIWQGSAAELVLREFRHNFRTDDSDLIKPRQGPRQRQNDPACRPPASRNWRRV